MMTWVLNSPYLKIGWNSRQKKNLVCFISVSYVSSSEKEGNLCVQWVQQMSNPLNCMTMLRTFGVLVAGWKLNWTICCIFPGYSQAAEHLQSFIADCDRRTELAKKRLAETQDEISAEVAAKVKTKEKNNISFEENYFQVIHFPGKRK